MQDNRIHKQLKVPPHSLEAEQAVIGGLMIKNTAWDNVADVIRSTDFYRQDHALIFSAIDALARESKPFDVVTLSEHLQSLGQLEQAGGMVYLGNLANETPSAANITAYASIVRDKSILRQLVDVGDEISASAYNPEGEKVNELLDRAESKVFDIKNASAQGSQHHVKVSELTMSALERINSLYESGDEISGVSTGFSKLDEMTSGLQAGDLIILAARPSMGKTSLALNIAENVAMNSRLPVAVFSMEMSGQSLATRMISSLGRVSQSNLLTGRLQDSDWPRVTSAVSLLAEAKIFIDDQPGLSPTDLRARARRVHAEHGLSLIVIDYLQLMKVVGAESRVNEISEISRSLKALARELEVPVIALSQLSRNVESRPDKRPMMSDLRESGAIEQDADLVCFIYRDEYYNENSEQKGVAEVIIGKQRNGPTGTCRLAFLPEFTKFEDLAPNYYTSDEYPD